VRDRTAHPCPPRISDSSARHGRRGALIRLPGTAAGPGLPVRGRNAAGRAEDCWLPIARGLTPHGLRHTHKTLMDQLGTEDGLTGMWKASLDARRSLSPGSPVAALDRLLRNQAAEVGT
jgi:hypothetical protein